MPRTPDNPQEFSDRFQEAIDVVSALGEPEAHFQTDPYANWGDVDDDYHQFPPTDVTTSSREEVEDYYDSLNSADNEIRIL